MNARRIVWFGVSTLAIASWFAAASTSGVRPPVIPIPPSRPSAVDLSMTSLQSEIGRLHERLGPTATPTRSRDLFRFQARRHKRPAAVASRPTAAADEAPAAAAVPPLALIGVAEDAAGDGVIRTAIISGFGDVFLVGTGASIRDRYHIGQVSADTVQVIDLTTETSTTLALR